MQTGKAQAPEDRLSHCIAIQAGPGASTQRRRDTEFFDLIFSASLSLCVRAPGCHRQTFLPAATIRAKMPVEQQVEPQAVAHTLEDFLAGARDTVAIEDGIAIFELRSMRYSVTDSHGKCLLHLWSPERNIVRRVLDVEQHGDALRLTVQKFGQSKPTHIEFLLERDRRTPSARKSGRAQYQRRLQAALEREFPGWKLDRMSSAMDLERSFGPVHA
jgi:hypothetical protein